MRLSRQMILNLQGGISRIITNPNEELIVVWPGHEVINNETGEKRDLSITEKRVHTFLHKNHS